MYGRREGGMNWEIGIDIYTLLVAQTVKCLSAMLETGVQSLGQEDPLKKEMATHFNILAWKMPWTEEPCRLQSTGLQRVRHDQRSNTRGIKTSPSRETNRLNLSLI